MMTLREIETAASALGNQLMAGISLQDALKRMAQLQKKHETSWMAMAEAVGGGRMLSGQLTGLWPENLQAAVVAGEMSGALPDVFHRIEETMQLQIKIRGAIWKIAYPVILGAAGLLVFLFFMVVVLPALSKALGPGDKGFIFNLSNTLHDLVTQHGMMLAVGVVCVLAGIVGWIRKASSDGSLVAWMTSLPYLGDGMRDLYFGLWAYYLSIMDAAGGFQVRDKLILSSEVMPETLRSGVNLMADEVVLRGLANAADPEKQMIDDPRRNWPFYIPTAFIVAQETGDLGKEMMRVAPALIRDGFRKIDLATKIFSAIALAISAFLIVTPLMAYYMQLGAMLRNALQGS